MMVMIKLFQNFSQVYHNKDYISKLITSANNVIVGHKSVFKLLFSYTWTAFFFKITDSVVVVSILLQGAIVV